MWKDAGGLRAIFSCCKSMGLCTLLRGSLGSSARGEGSVTAAAWAGGLLGLRGVLRELQGAERSSWLCDRHRVTRVCCLQALCSGHWGTFQKAGGCMCRVGGCGIYFFLLCFFFAFVSSGICQVPAILECFDDLRTISSAAEAWREPVLLTLLMGKAVAGTAHSSPWPQAWQSWLFQRRFRQIVSLPS